MKRKSLEFISTFYYHIVLFVALLSSLVAVTQSLKGAQLVDYAYQIENAYRIYSGELPYRDFFLVLPPGTYGLLAASMFLTHGYSHLGHMLVVIIETFVMVVTTGFLLKKLTNDTWTQLILLFFCICSGHATYPWVSYELDTMMFILIGLALWMHFKSSKKLYMPVLFGIIFSIPAYFKQNLGLIFAAGMIFLYGLAWIRFRKREIFLQTVGITLGVIFSYSLFFLWLSTHGIVHEFIYQTFTFPGRVKQPLIAIQNVINAYAEYFQLVFRFSWIWIPIIAIFLIRPFRKYRVIATQIVLSTGFIYLALIKTTFELQYYPYVFISFSLYLLIIITVIVTFFKSKTVSDFFSICFPLVLLFVCHAAYLSQIPLYAYYGISSLFVVMLIPASNIIRKFIPEFPIRTLVVGTVLFLEFILFKFTIIASLPGSTPINVEGEVVVSKTQPLTGLATKGTWIPDMEQIIQYADKYIPINSAVAFFPGEDPFFAITRRKNPLPFVQFQLGTYPMFERNILTDLSNAHVEWIIVKYKTQLLPQFGLVDITDPYFNLASQYKIVETFPHYLVWKKI